MLIQYRKKLYRNIISGRNRYKMKNEKYARVDTTRTEIYDFGRN